MSSKASAGKKLTPDNQACEGEASDPVGEQSENSPKPRNRKKAAQNEPPELRGKSQT